MTAGSPTPPSSAPGTAVPPLPKPPKPPHLGGTQVDPATIIALTYLAIYALQTLGPPAVSGIEEIVAAVKAKRAPDLSKILPDLTPDQRAAVEAHLASMHAAIQGASQGAPTPAA